MQPPSPPTVDLVVKWMLWGFFGFAGFCGGVMLIVTAWRWMRGALHPAKPDRDCSRCPIFVRYKELNEQALSARTVADMAREKKQADQINQLLAALVKKYK